jgi:hypothetical protein
MYKIDYRLQPFERRDEPDLKDEETKEILHDVLNELSPSLYGGRERETPEQQLVFSSLASSFLDRLFIVVGHIAYVSCHRTALHIMV